MLLMHVVGSSEDIPGEGEDDSACNPVSTQRPRGQGVLVCFAKKNTVAWSHSAMPLAPEATGRPGGHSEAKVAVSQLRVCTSSQ